MNKAQRLNPKPENHSPGMAKKAGERSNALSPRSEGRLQTRTTINHRRRRMSRKNRRNRTRKRGTPTRRSTQIRRSATSRRRRAISRARARARARAISRARARATLSRPKARRPTARHQSGPRSPIGRTRMTIFWHFQSKS